jgi:hypothetical protein
VQTSFSYAKVSERAVAEALTKAEMHTTFFAEGAHSLDNTGEQSEADFPLYVQIF